MIQLICLTGDVLVYIISFLQPPDIISLAKTCRSFYHLSRLRIVWTNARTYHVIANGYPLLSIPPERLSSGDLSKYTRHAFGLGERWLAGISTPRKINRILGRSGTYVSDVRFVPGFDQRLLLTKTSTGVSIWDISGEEPQKACGWSPQGAFFRGFVLNSERESEGTIVISLRNVGESTIKILSLKEVEGHFALHEIYSVKVDMMAITLSGDLLALSNLTQTAIWNWRLGTGALLDSAALNNDENQDKYQFGNCLQVVFAHQSILVVRTRTIHLFPQPILQTLVISSITETDQHPPPPSYAPLAHHSLGWTNGISVAQRPHLHKKQSHSWLPFSILARSGADSDDPWDYDTYNVGLYALDPNPDYLPLPSPASPTANITTPPSQVTPYIFPPRLTHRLPCSKGPARCAQVILGRLGTAVWIQPRNPSRLGLLVDVSATDEAKESQEAVTVAVFPGSLAARAPVDAKVWSSSESEEENEDEREEEGGEVVEVMRGERVWEHKNNGCASLDYDEELGRVALGTSCGEIWIFEL